VNHLNNSSKKESLRVCKYKPGVKYFYRKSPSKYKLEPFCKSFTLKHFFFVLFGEGIGGNENVGWI